MHTSTPDEFPTLYSPDVQSKRNACMTVAQWEMRTLRKTSHHSPIAQQKPILRPTKHSPPPSTLHSKLKKHHKTRKEGTQVLNLPKLPFGRHQPYNTEDDFIKSHFVVLDTELTPRRKKGLNDLHHKVKLAEKRSKNKYRSVKQGILASDHNKVVVQLRSGSLVLSKLKDPALEAYEFQQSQFALKKLTITNHEYERSAAFEEELNKRVRSLHSSIDLDSSSTRLHEGFGSRAGSIQLSQGLARKFDELNEITADSTRWLKQAKQITRKRRGSKSKT